MISGRAMAVSVAGQSEHRWGVEGGSSMPGPDNTVSISPRPPPVAAAVRITNSMGCVKLLISRDRQVVK